jgi:hypothetical protein
VTKKTSNGPSGSFFSPAAGGFFQIALVAASIAMGAYFEHADLASPAAQTLSSMQRDTGPGKASPAVRQFAQWAVESQDHAGLPFVVVDKTRARLFAFDAQGLMLASTPVLLGATRGDGPAVPETPAGRFVADTWLSARSDGIVWVHDGNALSLHGMPSDLSPGRGPQRLASLKVEDRRISDGSLHVGGDFYRKYLSPLRTHVSVAYVLPEVLTVQEVFHQESHPSATRYAHTPRAHGARRPS